MMKLRFRSSADSLANASRIIGKPMPISLPSSLIMYFMNSQAPSFRDDFSGIPKHDVGMTEVPPPELSPRG